MGFVQNCLMNKFVSWSVITKVYVRFLFVFGSTLCRIWLKQWPQSYRTGSRRISENERIDWVNANIQVIRNLPWHLTFLVLHHLFVLLALQIPPLTVECFFLLPMLLPKINQRKDTMISTLEALVKICHVITMFTRFYFTE